MPDLSAVGELLNRLVGTPVSGTFGVFLVIHIGAGLVCVITGAIALLSPKQRGRHPRAGEFYFWGLGSSS